MSKSLILFIFFLLLFLSGIGTAYRSSRPSSPHDLAKKITRNLHQELDKVEKEAKYLSKQISSGNKLDGLVSSSHAFFVYKDDQVLFWSDNSFVPSALSVADVFTLKLLKTGNGDYLIRKWNFKNDTTLLAVIPLYRRFKISNDYLSPQWNTDVFPTTSIIIKDPNSNRGEPVFVQGNCVFKISLVNEDQSYHYKTQRLSVVLLSLSMLLFVLWVYSGVVLLEKKRRGWGFVTLTLGLVALRILMVQFNFPNVIVITELFNPENFASSAYNSSLGDLILNEVVLLALCYYVFKNYYKITFLKTVYRNRLLTLIIVVLSVLGILFVMMFPFVVIQTLYNNSSISLDVSQSLKFDSLRIASLVAILLAWGCSFLMAHVCIRLSIIQRNHFILLISFLLGIALFILINRYSGQVYVPSLVIGCLYFSAVRLLKLYSNLRKLSYGMFAYLFVAIFCFSVNGAYAIQHFTRIEKTENQFRFANNFLIDRDYFGEYLLHDVSSRILKDAFIRMRMSNPFFNKDAVRQKVRQVFIPGYFNKYDVNIFLFNSLGGSYENRSPFTFSELINQYDKEAFRTNYKEVYFINSPSPDVTQKYLVIVPISYFTATRGYIVVELSLKKIIPENVYPELLVGNHFQKFYKTQDLSYAVFSNKDIVFSAGEFNYGGLFQRDWLGNPDLYKQGIEESGYIHIAQEDEIGRAAVVSSKSPPVVSYFSNFSFLLVLGFFIVLVFILIQGVVSYVRGNKIFFSTRIQLFLNLAFFLPLIVVSVVTLSLSSRSSKEQLDAEYLSRSKAFGDQIAAPLDDYLKYVHEDQIDFENQLTNLAKLTNLDANVYNLQGMLTATSQPLIFENNLLSTYINPAAFHRIRSGENIFIGTEHVGKLKYFVSYAAIKSPQSGKLIGILGIPFFQSVYSLERIQIIIFTNILNIFAGIFIVLLVLSYFVSQWLTFPLKFITQSLRKTSLTKTNQPLSWRADDEIGLMVKEYNQMLFKLGESKAELEQTQRERAWREIAQQVAHEIKNPLTPMKLMLQQLERALQTGSNSNEKTQKAISSLLTQVDTLDDIASSFSSFAKMPVPVIQQLELVSLIKRIITLHNQTEQLRFKTSHKEVFVLGDEQLLGRTFSNIILNSLQAARPGVALVINISVTEINEKVLIMFVDNGKGIAAENIDRVFIPHFSTKKSGSGLGLAIARQAIELMDGRIWFKTDIDKGTTFYI